MIFFDILPANAVDMIVLQEDKDFLLIQLVKGLWIKPWLPRRTELNRSKKAEDQCEATTSKNVVLTPSNSIEEGNSSLQLATC